MAQFFKGTKNLVEGALDKTRSLANEAVESTKDMTSGLFHSRSGGHNRSPSNSAENGTSEPIKRRASSMLPIQAAKKKLKRDVATKIQLARDITQPCDVYSWLEVTIQSIDVVSQTFDCSVEIHLFWQDFALPSVFPEYDEGSFEIDSDCLPLKMSEIFENQISHSITVEPMFDFIEETSTIYMMFVCQCTFVERMELQRFPLDRQFLTMQLNAYTGKSPTGNWNWILTKGLEWVPFKYRHRSYWVRLVASISSEYDLKSPWIDFKTNEDAELTRAGSNPFDRARSKSRAGKELDGRGHGKQKSSHGGLGQYGTIETGNDGKIADYAYDGPILSEPNPLSIALRVERNPQYYYGSIVFPNFLIGLGCAGAFVVPADELADRMGVLITLMLAAVAFRFVVSTMLPRISYLTLMDKYLLFSFIMIIMLIGENTAVAIETVFSEEIATATDSAFVIGFYVGWILMHFFFVVTLIRPGFHRIDWVEMYDIDSEDGESKEMVVAQYQNISTRDETESCKQKWKEIRIQENDKND